MMWRGGEAIVLSGPICCRHLKILVIEGLIVLRHFITVLSKLSQAYIYIILNKVF